MIILAFCGRMKCGKTEASNAVMRLNSRFRRASFAEPLKSRYAKEFGVPVEHLYDNLYKEAHRVGLQKYGSDYKAKYGEDYWAKQLMVNVLESGHDAFVIDDLRFFEEIRAIQKVGRVYRIAADDMYRKERGWEPGPADQHISETELGDVSSETLRTFKGDVIYNNYRTLDLLEDKIAKMLLNSVLL